MVMRKKKEDDYTFSVGWHEQCVINRKLSLELKRRHLEDVKISVDRLEVEIAFLEKQIEAAKASGKKFFDPERFLKKRKS